MPTVEPSSTTRARSQDQQVDSTATDDRRDTVSHQDQFKDGIEVHVGVQAAQAKVTEATCRESEAIDEMAKLKSLMETSELKKP